MNDDIETLRRATLLALVNGIQKDRVAASPHLTSAINRFVEMCTAQPATVLKYVRGQGRQDDEALNAVFTVVRSNHIAFEYILLSLQESAKVVPAPIAQDNKSKKSSQRSMGAISAQVFSDRSSSRSRIGGHIPSASPQRVAAKSVNLTTSAQSASKNTVIKKASNPTKGNSISDTSKTRTAKKSGSDGSVGSARSTELSNPKASKSSKK